MNQTSYYFETGSHHKFHAFILISFQKNFWNDIRKLYFDTVKACDGTPLK